MEIEWIEDYIKAQHLALESIDRIRVKEVIDVLSQANATGKKIFVCGNGGNAANASHFTTDLGKNASAAMPKPFRVMSINDNVSWMTAIGNDFSYDDVFVCQLMNHADTGDLLITSSVSGSSPNVVKALEWAREKGMTTIVLVGGRRGKCVELADYLLVVEETHYGRVEDVQMHILHMLCYAIVEKTISQQS